MVYKLRDDVVLERISGIYMLVALRSAWEECPFALQIAPTMADIWNWIKEGVPEDEIIKKLTVEKGFSETKAERIFSSFIKSSETNHYLLKESQ